MEDVPYTEKSSLHIRIVCIQIHRQPAGCVVEMTDESFYSLPLSLCQV